MRPAPVTPDGRRSRPLVVVGHGSRDPHAGATLGRLVAAVRERLPGVEVRLAWIELDEPLVGDALAAAPDAAVVPLLLSRGTHTARDLPADAAPPLGPDPLLTVALLDRLREAGIPRTRPLVLAATGSTDRRGRADVEAQAQLLRQEWAAPVEPAYVTAQPDVAAVRESLGDEAAVLGYFLAPGRLPASAQPDTAPLGAHPAVVELVVRRYQALLA